MINAVNRANEACESRHAGSGVGSNRCESDMVELTRGHQVVHYGGDTNLHMDRPDRDQAPAKGPDHGRALCVDTDAEPRARRPAKAAGTRDEAGDSTEAPCQRGSWRAEVARLPKRTGWSNPLAKAGWCWMKERPAR
nr:hypothetical protein StreXyl84_78650 [Streptomyces sp. Xyl84]